MVGSSPFNSESAKKVTLESLFYLIKQPPLCTRVLNVQLLHNVCRHESSSASEGRLVVTLRVHLTVHFDNST